MMFDQVGSDEFRAHGVGAMAWQKYDVGKPSEGERLVVVVPHAKRGVEWLHVYPRHAPNNWARPGDVDGWDGNREEPTFNPSIDCSNGGKDPGGWHGYIVKGRVCGGESSAAGLRS